MIRQRFFSGLHEAVPAGWMTLSVACAALASVYAKRLGSELPVLQIVFIRFLFFVVLAAPIIIYRNKSDILPRNSKNLHIVRSLFATLTILCLTYALKFTSISVATALLYTYPLMVFGISAVLGREAFSTRSLLVLSIGFIGVIFCSDPSGITSIKGVVFSILCALFLSLRMLVEKEISTSSPPILTSFWGSLISSALLAPVALFVWEPVGGHLFSDLFWFSALATLCQTFVIFAVLSGSVVRLSAIGYSEIVFSMVFAIIFFSSYPTALQIVGSVLIVFAGISIGKGREEQNT